MRTRLLLVGAAPFAGLLALWTLVTGAGWVSPVFLPPPLPTARAFAELFSWSFAAQHLGPSCARVGTAFLISVALAFPLGLLSGQSALVARLTHPLLGFLRYLPVAALVPLCILWFGIDDAQKIAVITVGVALQLTLLFAGSSAGVSPELLEAGRAFGLGRAALLWRVVLPAAAPALWDDLRVSAGWAWSYLVLSELVAGSDGIGYFVVQSQRYLQTERVFAGIFFIGLLGVATDGAFRRCARALFPWL